MLAQQLPIAFLILITHILASKGLRDVFANRDIGSPMFDIRIAIIRMWKELPNWTKTQWFNCVVYAVMLAFVIHFNWMLIAAMLVVGCAISAYWVGFLNKKMVALQRGSQLS